jgi:hypothetical protein
VLSAEQLKPIYERNGRNAQRTADELGIAASTLKGWASYREIRSPFIVTGRTTLTNLQTGEQVLQWERESLDGQMEEEARQAAFEALSAELPRVSPVPRPTVYSDSLCNVYSYFDYHVGMLAWNREGGDDWDLRIAEDILHRSYEAMVAQAPSAKKAIVVIGGDWVHTDGLLPLTPANKHVLDADGRFSKIVQVAIRGIRLLVRHALGKHSEVELVVMEGNHDESGSVWLRHMLAALYENEPRLTVTDSEIPYYVVRWGETMLGFHHGHKIKNEQLPLLFAAQFPKVWGETTKRAIHCGHRHHVDEKEYNGVTVIQHPTLAARDAYAARGGWIAERAVQAITYHSKFGQVGRVYVCPEMLREA